ncbi:MAG: diguanylate cyclase [Bdellovibrionales bacterium]
MKIEEVRTSFTVYVIASQLEQYSGLTESLSLAGYMVAGFTDLTSAFSEFFTNPPHFLLLDAQEKTFDLKRAIGQVVTQLPESHIFLITPVNEREKAVPYLEQGVYDLILMPLVSQVELVRSLDRAAERDYFMYLNERLMQAEKPVQEASTSVSSFASPQNEPAPPGFSEDFHLEFARKLFAQTTVDECIQVFLASASHALGSCPAVFFRYVQNRRVLMASFGEQITDIDISGLGMDFNETAPGFRTVQLREPMRIESFVEMIKEVFAVKEFFAWPVRALGEIQGVMCFLTAAPAPALNELLQEWQTLLEKAVSLVEAEKRLHVVSIRDASTNLLNRQTFITKIHEEVSRSRRTHLPTCLVQIAIDQFGQLSSLYGQEEAQLVLRVAARVLEKHSRVNDILGRTGVDEFGLLLPHTSKEGAMIKAERLRLLMESADFSKVLHGFSHLTISLGVSEYPGMVRDSDELLQSADEALFQVRKAGNKTCIAKAPEGFEPDFRAEEKGP